MKKSIDDFKASLAKGGVRPTMFEVRLNFPSDLVLESSLQLSEETLMLTKATQLPGSTMTNVTVGLPAGQFMKLPGSRLFEQWNFTVINEDKMQLRSAFEMWSAGIIGHQNPTGRSNLSSYFRDAQVTQLDRNGNPIRTYTLHGLYPVAISAQELSYDATDTVSEFNVTCAYQYFTASNANNLAVETINLLRDLL